MLLTAKGCRLFISLSHGSSWTEVSEIEAIGGGLGGEWEMQDVTSIGDVSRAEIKGLQRRSRLSVVMANLPSDAGQLLLWTAYKSPDPVFFRIVLSDQTSTRQWEALVVKMDEVFDQANSVLRLQADLSPTSDFIKGTTP